MLTADGRDLHETVHSGSTETRNGVRICRTVGLCSKRLGISGQADVVEFHRQEQCWVPYPVEYKRGKPKKDQCDMVQLCAQALCLEEMTGQPVEQGALFYGKTCRRVTVVFDDALRQDTEDAIRAVHTMFSQAKTPKPEYASRCHSCSLYSICMPKAFDRKQTVSEYLKKATEGL